MVAYVIMGHVCRLAGSVCVCMDDRRCMYHCVWLTGRGWVRDMDGWVWIGLDGAGVRPWCMALDG